MVLSLQCQGIIFNFESKSFRLNQSAAEVKLQSGLGPVLDDIHDLEASAFRFPFFG